MATTAQKPKLVVIVGPTASGKSALSLKIAKEFDGEIICADSRTVYKGIDIGTAKPTKQDRAKVKHWGLDLVEPGQRFTAYRFKKYAQAAISDINSRGKLSILVGGTGLYIDSVIFDFGFRDDANLLKRQKLESLSVLELQEIIKKAGYKISENSQNKRHLIRAIETKGRAGARKSSLPKGVILVGILPPDGVIKEQVGQRAEQIFANGVLSETKKLVRKYGKEAIAETGGIAYKICLEILAGKIIEAEAIEKFKKADWQYARRQKTWFRRNKFIHWFSDAEQASNYIKAQLNT
ncbi:MAG: tRNA (adenosine(37)-N6)-dimethylallyltransferase MiaA [Patescibacteria group bacterium]